MISARSDVTESGTVNNKNVSSAIGTFIRIKPSSKYKDLMQYSCRDVNVTVGDEAAEGAASNSNATKTVLKRSLLELTVPAIADRGIVYNKNNEYGKINYEYDGVYDIDIPQDVIYNNVVHDKVSQSLDGINSTIFAYGQTGSGKTYTMIGGDGYNDRGIIPRTLSALFALVSKKIEDNKYNSIKIRISFIEVYQESIYDLLDSAKSHMPRDQWIASQLYVADNNTIILKNVNVYDVTNVDDALAIFFVGNNNRITSSTYMNNASSRSHAIFTIIVETESIRNNQTVYTMGKINLVDLAGSERIYKHINSKGQVKEGKSINLSLHHLEQVIVSLRDHNNSHNNSKGIVANSHIPYRNSVLTTILRDSLGGNSNSSFILTLSMEEEHFDETVSTCRFGQRCGEVHCNTHANVDISAKDKMDLLVQRQKQLEKKLLISENKCKELSDIIASNHITSISHVATDTNHGGMTASRVLTVEEKTVCKDCVQRLLSAAKEALALEGYNGSSGSSSSSSSTTPEAIIDASLEALFNAVQGIHKDVLVELTQALGGLVQSMYMAKERERNVTNNSNSTSTGNTEVIGSNSSSSNSSSQPISASRNVASSPGKEDEPVCNQFFAVAVEGATFVKYSRYGYKQRRFIRISPDGTHLILSADGATNTSAASASISSKSLHNYSSASIDVAADRGNVITLIGKNGTRSLTLEYVHYSNHDSNNIQAAEWCELLTLCMNR